MTIAVLFDGISRSPWFPQHFFEEHILIGTSEQLRAKNGISVLSKLTGLLWCGRVTLWPLKDEEVFRTAVISGFINLQADQTEVEIGTSYSLLQNLTWIRGGHTFKFGGDSI